jgi:hypothetical protein
MQYVTGYILPNELDVLLHTDGTERRFEKVYERPIKLYKEFNNSFTIVVKNQDQKKQFVNDASCELQISNEDDQLVITKTGVVQDDGSSTATKGHIKFTLSESDMLKLLGMIQLSRYYTLTPSLMLKLILKLYKVHHRSSKHQHN